MTFDVVVVGAGIVGAAVGERLLREGLRVCVVEAGIAGGGATAAGMGHVVVMDDSEAEFALSRYSRDLWMEIAGELPAGAEFERTGTLWVAADSEEMEEVYRKARWYGERGMRAEVLDAGALREAEPNLASGLAGGLLLPDDLVVYAPVVVRWLLRDLAVKVGRVVSVDLGGVVLEGGERIASGAVVVATGTAAGELAPELAVRARKGHLAITDRYPGFVRHQLIELGYIKSAHGEALESVAFNAQPRKTGQVLLGSSRQFDVSDSTVEEEMVRKMVGRAVEYMPGLGELAVIRTWTGLRASTEDKLPLIGRVGETNIWGATGHEGLGITTSLGTAGLIADMMMGRETAIDAAPYRVGRFGG